MRCGPQYFAEYSTVWGETGLRLLLFGVIMKSVSILLFFVMLLLTDCTNKKEEVIKPLEPDPKANWLKNVKNLGEIYTKSEIIELDTVKEALLGSPKKILVSNNNFLVVDGFSVKNFDMKGKYLGIVGKKGNGSGEYKYPVIVSANDEFILIYDNSLGRVNIYDARTRKSMGQINMKEECLNLLFYNNRIVAVRNKHENQKVTACFADFYTNEGQLESIQELMPPSYPRELCFLSGLGMYKINGDYLYIVHPDDMKIKCYDLRNRKSLWKCDYVSEKLNLEKLKLNSTDEDNEKWVMARSRLYGMEVIPDNFIQVQTEKGTMLYDMHGNYLTIVPFRNSPFSSSVNTTDKRFLYNVVMPKENSGAKILSNFSIHKYEIKRGI